MRRVFLSALVICAFVLSTLPASARSRRCPVKMPETLLSLYKKSDAIFIARFDRKEDISITSEGDGYSVVNVRSHFDVSSALKGETQKLFVLEDEEYRYKTEPQDENAPADQAVFIEDFEAENGSGALAAGDSVLLFLKKGEDGETLALTDYRDAVKRLSPEQMSVYVERIKELNWIFSGGKVDNVEIVAWLIRCAEDPATRWEGTFELLQSLERSEWKSRAKKTTEENGSAVETSHEDEDMSGYLGEVGDTSIFAELLTPEQKQTLADILLNREDIPANADSGSKAALAHGDRELIELVKRWGDTRIVPFLLERVRSGSYSPYENAQMMITVAEMIGDKEAASLAERFNEFSYEEDDAEIENAEPVASSEEQNIEAVAAEIEEPATEALIPEPDAELAEAMAELPTSVETEKPAKKTYREMRASIAADFLVRVDAVLAKAREDLAAK